MAAVNRFTAAAAFAAAFAMSAPAGAVDLPQLPSAASVAAHDGDATDAEGWRHRRYRRGGIGAGDIIAGAVILGTIATIANSSRNRDRYRDRDYRDRDYRPGDYYRGDYRGERRGGYDSSGMERAVDMCIAEVERSGARDRVEDIEESRRDRDGWAVAGRLRSGQTFSCRIGNDGRIDDIDMGGDFSARYDNDDYQSQDYDGDRAYSGARYDPAPADGQLSDDVYARARADNRIGQGGYQAEATPAPTYEAGPQPSYPGGPLPGEEGQDGWADDGRYSTAAAPDFTQS